MFTGLVAGQGEVVSLSPGKGQARLGIRPFFSWPDPRPGESVAVNGACLTMETWNEHGPQFTAYISAASLAATSLGDLRPGDRVNLERALALGDRLGGHLVSGHVDDVAVVTQVTSSGDSLIFRLEFDARWSEQILPKGSVALDGISLTVNECGPGFLEINSIPETQAVTTINQWKPGRRVNLETDLLGKYVTHLLAARLDATASSSGRNSGLSLDFLQENGFL